MGYITPIYPIYISIGYTPLILTIDPNFLSGTSKYIMVKLGILEDGSGCINCLAMVEGEGRVFFLGGVRNQSIGPLRIHGTGIFTYICHIFSIKNNHSCR